MILGDRLKELRVELGLSQEAIGAQGFVSAPGWIKIENGQRQASEKLIDAFLGWLVRGKHIPAGNREGLPEELLTLKYLGSNQPFLRDLAGSHARNTVLGQQLLARFNEPRQKPRRGRPPVAKS